MKDAVLAGQADGSAAMLVDEGDDLLVDQAAQHHLHHVHGLGVGHAHALHELALLAHALEQVVDLRAAAMDHHGVHADQLEQHHVAGEGVLELLVGHGVAAVLDDDGLAVRSGGCRAALRPGFWRAAGQWSRSMPSEDWSAEVG